MTGWLEEAFSTVASLPRRDRISSLGADQAAIQLTPAEDADLAEAEAEIERGELAAAEGVRAKWAKHGPYYTRRAVARIDKALACIEARSP